jgi:alcohol dehydrogenase class IV
MRFEFATATRIIFGEGTAATLPELVRSFGARPFVVTGASSVTRTRGWSQRSRRRVLAVHGEPTVDLVRDGARRVREAACDVVVAAGRRQRDRRRKGNLHRRDQWRRAARFP